MFFQSLTEDVNRQLEREKSLQQRYSSVQARMRQLYEQHMEQVQKSEKPTEPSNTEQPQVDADTNVDNE